MSRRSESVVLRLEPERKARWQGRARALGTTLTGFLVAAGDNEDQRHAAEPGADVERVEPERVRIPRPTAEELRAAEDAFDLAEAEREQRRAAVVTKRHPITGAVVPPKRDRMAMPAPSPEHPDWYCKSTRFGVPCVSPANHAGSHIGRAPRFMRDWTDDEADDVADMPELLSDWCKTLGAGEVAVAHLVVALATSCPTSAELLQAELSVSARKQELRDLAAQFRGFLAARLEAIAEVEAEAAQEEGDDLSD